MSGPLVFLDVNIPMYAAGKPHPYREPCIRLMRAIAEGQLEVAIDTEIIQEILYRYGALREWKIATTMSSDVLTLASVIFPVTVEDIRMTIDFYSRYAEKGVTARDLVHAAVMKNNGLSEIISVDEHFGLIEDVIRVDPVGFTLT